MKNISPEDKEIIEEFINGTRFFQKFNAFGMMVKKPREFFNIFDYLKMLKLFPLLKHMKKWQKMTAEEFSQQFSHPLLREITKSFISPILYEMLVLSEMDKKRSGYPIGGSLNFSQQIAKKYLQLGGKLHYKTQVVKIHTFVNSNPNKAYAAGLSTNSGLNLKFDIIISAMDGFSTHFSLLEGKFISPKLKKIYQSKHLNPSKLYISLGVNRSFSSEIPTQIIQLEKPIKIADGTSYESLNVRIFNFDPTLAPKGKTLINIELDTTNFDYWFELRQTDKSTYNNMKEETALTVIKILDQYFEGLEENIDMIDVATPATFYRYTKNWKGSIMGWAAEDIFEKNPFKKDLKTLKNFYMVGQWVQPGGGVPTSFLSGRDLAQIICKRDKKSFLTI